MTGDDLVSGGSFCLRLYWNFIRRSRCFGFIQGVKASSLKRSGMILHRSNYKTLRSHRSSQQLPRQKTFLLVCVRPFTLL